LLSWTFLFYFSHDPRLSEGLGQGEASDKRSRYRARLKNSVNAFARAPPCRRQTPYLLCQLPLPWSLSPNFQRCSQCSLNEWPSRRKAFDTCPVFGKTVLPGISVFPTSPYSVKKTFTPRDQKERNRNKGSFSVSNKGIFSNL